MLRNLTRSCYNESHLVHFLLSEIKFQAHDCGGDEDNDEDDGGDNDSVSSAV